jgi:SAM-dependent methyltransferase
VGLDLSGVMAREARRRIRDESPGLRCRFVVADLAAIPLRKEFDRILGVTVLQHILEPERLQASLRALASSLKDGGELVLLEAAPSRPTARCNSETFVARTEREYLEAFAAAGLCPVRIEAVDPAPFKTWFLPWYSRLPRALAVLLLLVVTAASLPVDLWLARWGRRFAWHKIFVLTPSRGVGR